MELEHFSHDHPLILKEEHKHDDNSGGDLPRVPCCDGCAKQIISGPFYNCDQYCNFFLHKSCAELPREIKHPFHPSHPLSLYAQPPYPCSFLCNACEINLKNFVYRCSLCDFDLDVKCASMMIEGTIEHPSHKHPLIFLWRPSLSLCDACGTKHEGNFYACTTCNEFWIHRDCASLSTIIHHTEYHDHPLTLAYCIPSQYSYFLYLCEICNKQVKSSLWVYYCGKCRYFAHVNCVTSKTENFMSIMLPKKEHYSSRRTIKIPRAIEDSHPDVVHLPMRDEFVSLVSHFHKEMKLRANENTPYDLMFCHEHSLVLFDVQGNDSEVGILNHTKYYKTLCNACLMPISATPFYKCVDGCNFLLHKCCTELPYEIRHPFHPQHLLVLRLSEYLSYFWCEGCKFLCNGFSYFCADCKYNLDVVCASLPSTIMHEAHIDHPLSLKKKISRHCSACHGSHNESAFAFCCGTCDFEIHAPCATYPSTVIHRYDEIHPFKLTYHPVEDHSDDYYCDICERELNPLWWFYHCVDCDKSMHAWCHPMYDCRSKLRFGGVFTIESHSHPVSVVPVIGPDVQCNDYVRVITQGNICSKCVDDFYCDLGKYGCYPVGIKCLECNFKIHLTCLYQLANDGQDYAILKEF